MNRYYALAGLKYGRQLLIFLPLFAFLTVQGQKDYQRYPDYVKVVSYFFDNYSIQNIPASARVRFEKRPTGWHVTVIDYSKDQQVISNELFWNRKNSNYQKIHFAISEDKEENDDLIGQYMNDWGVRYFRICPFYGYPGWDRDVIQEFEPATNLSDTLLYALGRAWSSFAGNLLNNHSGLADRREQFDLPPGKNCMNGKQLKKYRYYRHKAIEKFKRLEERNPGFETIVGTIGMKTSNEYLTSFLDLRMYQNEEEAMKEIQPGLYTEFYLGAARNYLNSCDPHAILFTNGDNDTYPLLYLQAQYGIRTDVLVVNMSLLNTDRYTNSLRDSILDAPGLPLTLTAEDIAGRNRQVVLIEKGGVKPFEINGLADYMKNNEHTRVYGEASYYYIPNNEFIWSQKENILHWKVDKPYLFRNQVILLDMLTTNQWQRPVYFAVTMEKEHFSGLDDYLRLTGLAYKLVPKAKAGEDAQTGSVSSAVMYDKLMNDFDWSGMDKLEAQDIILCKNYRNIFQRLAEKLLQENKTDSAERVLDRSIALMPDERVQYDYFMLPVIEDYYKLGAFDKGNEIARKLHYNLTTGTDDEMRSGVTTRPDIREVALEHLQKLLTKYGQDDIKQEIEP